MRIILGYPKAAGAALLACALLLGGCTGDGGQDDVGDNSAEQEQQSEGPELNTPQCVTEFDFARADRIDEDGYEILEPNRDGAVFVVEEDTPTAPYLVHAGNIMGRMPVKGLPEQQKIEDLRADPVPGGFVVGTEAVVDGLSTDGSQASISFVTNDGEVAWSHSTTDGGDGWSAAGTLVIDEPAGSNAPAWRFYDLTSGDEVEDPRPSGRWNLALPDGLSADPAVFVAGRGDYLGADGRQLTDYNPDVLYTDEWRLSVGQTKPISNTMDYKVTISGHHIDGGSQWERETKVPSESDTIGVCGQYVYVPAEDGIHVLDQDSEGEEIALFESTEEISMEPYQPLGLLLYSTEGEDTIASMQNWD